VKDDSGTGIVHQAPAFGDDDHRIAIREGIVRKDEMPPMPIDDQGRYTSEVGDLEGLYVKVRLSVFSLVQISKAFVHRTRTRLS